MTKEGRENKRLRIKQKHLVATVEETDRLLHALENDIQETIDLYKEKDWKPNQNHERWLNKIKHIRTNIKRRKHFFKEELTETVPGTRLNGFE